MTSDVGDKHDGPSVNEHLLQRLGHGERGVFDELYQRNHDSARRVAVALAGQQDADELVATALFQMYTRACSRRWRGQKLPGLPAHIPKMSQRRDQRTLPPRWWGL